MTLAIEQSRNLNRSTRLSGLVTRIAKTTSPVQIALPSSTVDAIERGYAAHVASRVRGQVLRYSDRLELLRAAERLRINRFRANLIIAMVQHEHGKLPGGSALIDEPSPRRSILSSTATMLTMVMLTELLIVAALWWQLAGPR